MRFLCFLSALFIVTASWSQSKINIDYAASPYEEVYLGYHYGDKQYILDTLTLDGNGKINYQSEEDLPGGIYLIIYPRRSNGYSEFLWDGKEIDIKVIGNDQEKIPEIEISNNEIAEKFVAYLEYLAKNRMEAEDMNDGEKNRLNKEIKSYIEKEINKNRKNQYGKMVAMLQDPEIPEEITDNSDRFYYYRSVYLNSIPFDEEWIIRTPTYWNKIDTYLEKMTVKHHDSLVASVDHIIDQIPENTEMYKFTVIKIFNKYVNSKLMASGNVYVHMASKYYLSGKAFWADEKQIQNIEDRYLKMKYNVLGANAVDFKVKTHEETKVKLLEQSQAEYTILFFWDSDCSHCIETAKEFTEYFPNKPAGATILGIHTNMDMIDEFPKINESVNHPWKDFQMIDPSSKIFYDIYSTPVIYILDKDNKILAKRLSVEQTIGFIDKLLKEE